MQNYTSVRKLFGDKNTKAGGWKIIKVVSTLTKKLRETCDM